MEHCSNSLQSPYSNLTQKYDDEHMFISKRHNKRNKLCSFCIGLGVLVCVLACIFSGVSAVYCFRVSQMVTSIQNDILSHSNNEMETRTGKSYTAKLGMSEAESSLDELADPPMSSFDELADPTMSSFDELSDPTLVDDRFDTENEIGQESDYDETSEELDDEYIENEYFEGSGIAEQDEPLRLRREAVTNKPKGKRTKATKNTGKRGKRKDKKAKLRFLPAAQYDGSVTNEVVKKVCPPFSTYDGKSCAHVPDMEGTLCNNQSFIPDKRKQALRILKPEDWVTKDSSPVDFKDSVMTVKSSGVHLVYAQVLFSGYEAKKSAIVAVNGKSSDRKLSCNVDTWTNSILMEDIFEKNLETCSIFGLLHLNKGDTLELQTGNEPVPIERLHGSTYVGIIQINKDK